VLSGIQMRTIANRYEKYWQSKRYTRKSANPKPSDLIETIDSALRKSTTKLLDVGCGNGYLMNIAKKKAKFVYGCDISRTAVKEAKRKGMVVVCADLNSGKLPYADEGLDDVTCIEVIEHVLDPMKLLRDIYRVLKPNGQLVLTTPNIRCFKNLVRLLFEGTFPHTTKDNFVWGGGHLHYFTRKDIQLLLQKAGFKSIKFYIAANQFKRSKKRQIVHKLTGDLIFGELFCNGITVKAIKK